MDEPVYDGEPLSVWLNRVATERSSEKLYNALQAVKKLVGPTNAEQVRSSLMSTMATVAQQNIKIENANTSLDRELLIIISDSFQDNEQFYEYIVKVLQESDNSLKSRNYSQLIRFEQTKATPLINFLISDVFPTETDPKIVRLAADYARNYLLINREVRNVLIQELADALYANEKLPLDFWLEYLPPENFFGYAEIMQQKAIEAIRSESSSDELITQAAIILTEFHRGIGPVQVSLSEQDKKRVAGQVANLLERLAERPAEIAKLISLNKSFANLAKPRYYSQPYPFSEIKKIDTNITLHDNASLALELLELAETIGLYTITDAAINRVVAATLAPSLNAAMQMHPKFPGPAIGLNIFDWPDLKVGQQGKGSRSREYNRLPLDKTDLLAYLVNIAGYHALSEGGKEHAREVFISQFAEIHAASFLAEHDRDGNRMLSKEEAPLGESDFQAFDQDGDESLSQAEIHDFIKSKLMAAATQDQSNAAKSIDPKTLEYAKRIIERNDANKDDVLDVAEWRGLLVNPSPADTNRDGKITPEEYALWMQCRQNPR